METKQLSKVFFTLCLMLLSGIPASFAQGASEFPTGINPNPTDIKLEPSSLNLRIHEKARLKATVQPSGANQDVTWEVSKDSNVVSVDKTGRVNAKAVGTATIVVTSTVNTMVSKTCTVTVRNPEESNISSLNNLIYIEKQDLHPGTTATLSIQMKNTAAIRGFQFDLYLPKGFSVIKNSNDRIMAELNPERLPDGDVHKLTTQEQKDGAIRFLCNSFYDETFKGNDGEIATLKVTIAEDVQNGNYPIIITDMKLTETDTDKFYETPYLMIPMNVYYILGDVNGDEKVDISDYTGVANHILGMQQQGFVKQAADVDGNGKIDVSDYTGIANFIMKGSFSGKSSLRKSRREAGIENNYLYVQDKELQKNAKKDVEVTLTISMKNEAPIRGFQFDIYLPEGISVVKNNGGRIKAMLCAERLPEYDQHDLTSLEQEGGAIRFLCSSRYDETFTGNDGGLLTLQVNISKDLEPGEYPVLLKRLKLTETDIYRFYEADEVPPFTIKVMDGDAIHDIRAAEEEGIIYDLSGKAVSNPNQQGVIIVNGKKIVNK